MIQGQLWDKFKSYKYIRVGYLWFTKLTDQNSRCPHVQLVVDPVEVVNVLMIRVGRETEDLRCWPRDLGMMLRLSSLVVNHIGADWYVVGKWSWRS